MSTMFTYDDPEQGRRVLNVAVPVGSPRRRPCRQLGHPRHARHRQQRHRRSTDVFVPRRAGARQPAVRRRRPAAAGHLGSIAFPIISGVYLGVAEAAYQAAVAARRAAGRQPLVQRQVGLMRHKLQVASWALDGALAAVGDDPGPSAETLPRGDVGEAEIAEAGIEVCDLAMEVAGGRPSSRAR